MVVGGEAGGRLESVGASDASPLNAPGHCSY